MEYLHFILGYTTEAEFNRLKANTSAPYFDLEVWDYGVLHSGPRVRAETFSYEELYQAAVLWEKVSQVTTMGGSGSNQGIVFLYDPFVAAGAAVAFPGRRSVNCPDGWMTNSLNYNGIVTSGAWGNFHEYHHNFQNFGVGGGGEVTNNALTLVSYALFTKISAARTITNYGGDGLGGGWNRYTSASWALEEALRNMSSHPGSPSNGKQGLALYATLLHNFGPDNFMQAKQNSGDYQTYMNIWQNVTGYNMYYYFHDVLGGAVTENADATAPVFVPVASVYQTGRSIIGTDGQKQYIKTVQPFQIKDDEPYAADLTKYTMSDAGYVSGSIVIPDGFSYTVKNITQPAHGSIVQTADGFTYTPDTNDKSTTSGEIVVTLSITKDDGKFQVDDVDLVLEFSLTKELNKTTLQRTIYTYAGDVSYTDATNAFDNAFDGYTAMQTVNHTNPTQNANTDIWYYPNTEANHASNPNAPDYFFAHQQKTVSVIDGKLHFANDGKYRVYLRGRLNCAVYFSLDGKTYSLGAKIADSSVPNNSQTFRPNDSNTYFDIEFSEGNVTVYVNVDGGSTTKYNIKPKVGAAVNWLYVKEVLISEQQGNVIPYIGLGMKQWDKTQYNITKEYFNANGVKVADENAEGYEYTVSTYRNGNNVVAVEEVHLNGKYNKYTVTGVSVTESRFKEFVETPILNNQPYINAYRTSYEFPNNSRFASDYFYTRSYGYNYTDNIQLGVGNQRVVEEQCANLNLNTGWGGNDLSVVIDGIRDMGNAMQLHTNGKPTAENPFTLVIDLGKVYSANRLMIYSQQRNDSKFPTALNLYASRDGLDYILIDKFSDLPHNGITQTIDFTETQMRYYKIEVTDSVTGHLIIRELEMWHINEINGGKRMTPDGAKFSGNWKIANAVSTFGHVYVGKNGAKMTFEFTGTRLGILSSSSFGKKFDVYIDGKKAKSISLKSDNGATALTYLCDELESGTHKVEIKCTGEANIDSIVVFP